MTESGKTTKARRLAASYKMQGIGVIVLDPLRDPGWNADFITDDQEEFLDVFWRSRSCAAFLDEGGESVGRYDLAMQKTATRGRHCGHSCHYVAQKATQLAPIVRDQCSHLFLFTSGLASAKMLAEEFNKPDLLQATQLQMYSYFHATRFGHIKLVGALSNATNPHSNRRSDGGTRTSVAGEEEGSGDTGNPASDGGSSGDDDDAGNSASE